jgi:ketosteroid isomerase-like protein
VTVSDTDILELNRLAYRYAAAVDACDVDAFLAVFADDARLRSYHPDTDEPFADVVGHEQLASIPHMMRAMFRRTAHQMTNHLVDGDVDGGSATGTVLCTARHLAGDDDSTALVVVLRYVDRYERRNGSWLIVDRQIRFLWSERHPVVDSGF